MGELEKKYLENPLIKCLAIFVSVIASLIILMRFYQLLPISSENPSSIEITLKIIVIFIILILVMLMYILMELKKDA